MKALKEPPEITEDKRHVYESSPFFRPLKCPVLSNEVNEMVEIQLQ